jgi:hypothetical protein
LGCAIRFGRSIFERDQFWKDLRSRWASRLPFPLPETSIARALRFEHVARELVAMGDFEAALEQVTGMLTHQARATMLSSCIYPASRPELPMQLRSIKQYRIAEILESALRRRLSAEVLGELTHKTGKPLDQNSAALKVTAL